MATKYLNTQTVEFGGEQISIMYYMEDGLYTFKISHVILEPNGNINKPGGGTSMDTTLDGLKFKIFHCYLSSANFYNGCKMIYNDDF